MTKKDYILIAEALRRSRPASIEQVYARTVDSVRRSQAHGASLQHALMCTNIMQALAQENPKFDEAKFLQAINK